MTTSFDRGMAAAKSRDLASAVHWFRLAAAEQPEAPLVRAWLGQALAANGALLEGRRHLRDAGLALAAGSGPNPVGPVLQIVGQLQQWEAHAEALQVLDRLADGPALQIGRLRAASLSVLGRTEEAVEAAESARSVSPDDPMLDIFLSSLEIDAGRRDRAETRLTGLMQARLGPREGFRARKELARLRDIQHAYDDAFRLLREAEQLGPALPEYAGIDRTLMPRLIAQNESTFSAEIMNRWRGHAFDDRAPPLFIMGFFRSGTTLAQAIFASHPDAYVADEAPLIAQVRRAIENLPPANATVADKLAAMSAADIAKLRALYWAAARGRVGDKADAALFVDKFAMNVVDMGLISTIFPDSRILFMARDPRDVCLSCYQQIMPPSPATVHLLRWREIAGFYARVVGSWRAGRGAYANEILVLPYEEVVASFREVVANALAFAGLGWDDAVSNFHEAAGRGYISTPSRNQVNKPLYSGAVMKWHNYRNQISELAPLLEPLLDRGL